MAFQPTLTPTPTAATSDFNGDGHPDYVLYNRFTRQTAIWYLTLPPGCSNPGGLAFDIMGNLYVEDGLTRRQHP